MYIVNKKERKAKEMWIKGEIVWYNDAIRRIENGTDSNIDLNKLKNKGYKERIKECKTNIKELKKLLKNLLKNDR